MGLSWRGPPSDTDMIAEEATEVDMSHDWGANVRKGRVRSRVKNEQSGFWEARILLAWLVESEHDAKGAGDDGATGPKDPKRVRESRRTTGVAY